MRQRSKQIAIAMTIGAVGGVIVRMVRPKRRRTLGRRLKQQARGIEIGKGADNGKKTDESRQSKRRD